MKKGIIGYIAASLLALTSLSASAQKIDLTDFTLSRHGFVDTVKVEIFDGAVIVPVEIEGEVRRLMFDTGAEFGFWIGGKETWMQPSGKNISILDSQKTNREIPLYKVPSMTLGSTVIEGYPIIAQEEMGEIVCGRFDGGLGFNLVAKGLSFKLDTKDSLLIMTDCKRFFAKEEKGQPTLKYREDDVPRVYVEFPFTRVKMLFDTGWYGGWFDLPEYWLNRWSKNDRKMRQSIDELTVWIDTTMVTQAGLFGYSLETVAYRMLHIPIVSLDNLSLKDVWVHSDSHSVKVGSALLKRNSLIIDSQKKRLVFLPHDGNLEQVVENEGKGVYFIPAADDDTLGAVKAVVRKGSKAYHKGVRTGDYLVTVNGIPITDLCTYVILSNQERVTSMVLRTPDGMEKEIVWQVDVSHQEKEQQTQTMNKENKELTAFDVQKEFEKNGFTWFTENLILCSGDTTRSNAMTIGWGGIGNYLGHNRPAVTVYVAPGRYTWEFMEKYPRFTIMQFDDPDIWVYMGRNSGRDGDKAAALGLHVAYTEHGTPYYKEANLVIECETMSVWHQTEQDFRNDTPKKWYDGFDAGIHTVYVGEIIGAWRR